MKLTREGIKDRTFWEKAGIRLPSYDIEEAVKQGKAHPEWLHFGTGNIFRMFLAQIGDRLLEDGRMKGGMLCAAPHDFESLEKIYDPCDNLILAVTLLADGTAKKQVFGSVAEAVRADSQDTACWNRMKEIFSDPGLRMISFTITEKGYALQGTDGDFFPEVQKDLEQGPAHPASAMAKVCALLLCRYQAGAFPLAAVSMDNCSKNGERLKQALFRVGSEWKKRGFVDEGFLGYLSDESRISFPWTMIDKITPRPSESVYQELRGLGLEGMEPAVTKKNTYIAPFVNGEGPQYLVIEDRFPNGRPALEAAGVYLTDRQTVSRTERMKVTACLNPLHTALAVFGCLLGYTLIADEMKDEELKKLVWVIGQKEGLPVVVEPGILSSQEFVREVLIERLPNPHMPDTPQRIATDTSQKVGIRFGETIKAWVRRDGSAGMLTAIPLAIAGWLRYLLAVDDEGNRFEPSPDPMLSELQAHVQGLTPEQPEEIHERLIPILSSQELFGSDLYQAGIGGRIEEMFREMTAGPGAVRKTLKKYLQGMEI